MPENKAISRVLRHWDNLKNTVFHFAPQKTTKGLITSGVWEAGLRNKIPRKGTET